MTLEAAKELDRRCVWNWLNDVYRSPTVAFNTYSDAQQIEFAHDALVLLNKQNAVKRTSRKGTNGFSIVWTCGACGSTLYPNNAEAKYCSNCGQAVKWDD